MRRGALLLAVGVLAACGGSDGDDERLSKEELIRRADPICARHFAAMARHEEELAETPAQGSEPTDLAAFERVLPRLANEFRDLAIDLSELQPPEDLDARYKETLRLIEDFADTIDEAAEAAKGDNLAAMNAALSSSTAGMEAERFFADNGVEDCSTASRSG